MNTTRRDFFASGVAGVAVLLTGSLPKEWVPGCCPLKQFDQLDKTWSDGDYFPGWDKVDYVILEDGTKYTVVRVDSDRGNIRFASRWKDGTVDENCSCIVRGRDLNMLDEFEERVKKTTDKYRYLIVNNKNEYGFLATQRPCWNFRKYSE